MPSRTARLAGRSAALPPIDPFDEDAQIARSRDALKECQAAAVFFDPGPVISPKVDGKRAKVWGKWQPYEMLEPSLPFLLDSSQSNAKPRRYCRNNGLDHIKIWRDSIDDCLNKGAQSLFQGFMLVARARDFA